MKKVGIKVNWQKSAVMEILTTRGMRQLKGNTFFGVPATKSFKYLGITIDQTLKFEEEIAQRKETQKGFKQ